MLELGMSSFYNSGNLPFFFAFDNLSDVKVGQIRAQFIGKHFCPRVVRTVSTAYTTAAKVM